MSEIINVVGVENFDKVINSDKVVLVDFWATWCMPCMKQGPILHDLAEEIGDTAVIVKVDVDSNEALCRKYGVMSIPMLAVFKNGEIVEKTIGLTELKSLKGMIERHL
jgi:thioredoxin 1